MNSLTTVTQHSLPPPFPTSRSKERAFLISRSRSCSRCLRGIHRLPCTRCASHAIALSSSLFLTLPCGAYGFVNIEKAACYSQPGRCIYHCNQQTGVRSTPWLVQILDAVCALHANDEIRICPAHPFCSTNTLPRASLSTLANASTIVPESEPHGRQVLSTCRSATT